MQGLCIYCKYQQLFQEAFSFIPKGNNCGLCQTNICAGAGCCRLLSRGFCIYCKSQQPYQEFSGHLSFPTDRTWNCARQKFAQEQGLGDKWCGISIEREDCVCIACLNNQPNNSLHSAPIYPPTDISGDCAR